MLTAICAIDGCLRKLVKSWLLMWIWKQSRVSNSSISLSASAAHFLSYYAQLFDCCPPRSRIVAVWISGDNLSRKLTRITSYWNCSGTETLKIPATWSLWLYEHILFQLMSSKIGSKKEISFLSLCQGISARYAEIVGSNEKWSRRSSQAGLIEHLLRSVLAYVSA